MSKFVTDGKILGIIPVNQYAKISYLMVLGASAVGLLLFILALLGIPLGLGMVVALVGIAGLILAILGFTLFKDDMPALDVKHFIYIAVVWLAFYMGGFVGASLGAIGILLFAVGQTFMLYVGYNSWSRGRTIDIDTISSEIKAALKRS